MTGYTVHTGSNENFSNGWDRIFSDADEPEKPVNSESAKPKTAKKAAKAGGTKRAKSKARNQK